MAIALPKALPPIVNEAITAVVIKVTMKISTFKCLLKLAAMITPADPDIIPHISPITSLQKVETFSAFFLNKTATSAPFIFLEFIE